MRWLLAVLVVLLLLLQLRLWFGDGSVVEVWRLRRQVQAQHEENIRLRERNEALAAEVQDLKTGLEAVEERARAELGMIKEGETFYQSVDVPEVGEAVR